MLTRVQLWERFKAYQTEYPALGLSLDVSRMNFPDDFLASMDARARQAFATMKALEAGAIANPDEKRMVGHYWLRRPELAPNPELRREIEQTLARIKAFAAKIHQGAIAGARGPFKKLLVIGIGGSALGPQFVAHALSQPTHDKLEVYFFDNTDPDGMDKVLARLGRDLGQTLSVVISKSGGTQETRNGMLEAAAAYHRAGLNFGHHAVAVTGEGSALDKVAVAENWLERFPMWDWVGGRTSETSAVGLLPAALQGFDIDQFLAGAAACDEITRVPDVKGNPAMMLSLMWYYIGNGKGAKDMVILPYKDRLELFSRYLQQLVMESLGKQLDLAGKTVHQGIAVYGNKGSTDQHAYIQQLRDGLNNFFATFIVVGKEREGDPFFVEDRVTSGDFLHGFYLGTRQALYENGRESITLTIQAVSAFSVGMLIALFERAVGFYASLVNINAYHQPGVEAGKKAAASVIALQLKILTALQAGKGGSVPEIAKATGSDDLETVFKICEHLAANPTRKVVKSGDHIYNLAK
ncbi:MAG TPA: glucose-6-phosphate isomerase [Verrucomicrobiae bacterium]|jgi:glucose-6-phosphate isomerase|nr:glucose-6-phosphate isomerase [Verrucomicrobiae bacterium]